MGILMEILHVGMGRSVVEIKVIFLYVLTVIPLAVGQPEEALLQDRVAAVPARATPKQSSCWSSLIPARASFSPAVQARGARASLL